MKIVSVPIPEDVQRALAMLEQIDEVARRNPKQMVTVTRELLGDTVIGPLMRWLGGRTALTYTVTDTDQQTESPNEGGSGPK